MNKLLDELSSRQSSFRHGRPIRLADGQTWIIPAPPKGSEWTGNPFGSDYTDIIQAIVDAEDHTDERRAELALAIFLLGYNYRLSPGDYARLLERVPLSNETRDWQAVFRHFAQEHVRSFLNMSETSSDVGTLLDTQRKTSRVIGWLKDHLPLRWFSLDTRR